MPSQSVSAASQAQTPNATPADEVNRPSANFSPSIWGDHFLSYGSMETTDAKIEQQVQALKEKVKRMIMAPALKNPSQKMDLIDDIQRLGVSYHFESEIDEVLQQIHSNSYDHCEEQKNNDNLFTVALRFRLLRQQGYTVSCDVFNKFKDDDGKFKESLVNDVVGLLSLYEATHLSIHGEGILDEALTFTITHLENYLATTQRLNPPGPLSKQVTHALHQPFWKGFPRLEARHYLSIYEEDHDSHNQTIQAFAKLDFNILQQVHQRELSEIARWWKDLDFVNKLPFARDRVTECYFWALGVFFEPKYYFARRTLCKVIAMLVIIDDIFDVYGKYDELELFTEAVERWDISAMDPLPEYMKICYRALLDVYTEIEERLANEGNLYGIHYAKEAMKVQVRGYFQEAKWFDQKYTPTLDEYMSAALNTSYFMLATTCFVVMGVIVTKDSLDWVFSDPKIVKASSVIGRLMDDMRSHHFEQKRGHVASSMECYMKEYGATEEQTKIELTKQVNDAWKDINEACLHPTSNIHMPLLLPILNLTRVIEVLYKYEDGFTHAGIVLKDVIVSLFIEPVPV